MLSYCDLFTFQTNATMAENGDQEELNFSEEVGDGDQDTFADEASAADAEPEPTESGDADTSAQGEVEDPVRAIVLFCVFKFRTL